MIYTVDRPEGFRIEQTFGLVEATTIVRISDSSAWDRLFRSDVANHQEALNAFADSGPDEANAIVGVRASTTTLTDGKGAIHLVITYIGTPVLLTPLRVPAEQSSQLSLMDA